jgi:hypothetical protein
MDPSAASTVSFMQFARSTLPAKPCAIVADAPKASNLNLKEKSKLRASFNCGAKPGAKKSIYRQNPFFFGGFYGCKTCSRRLRDFLRRPGGRRVIGGAVAEQFSRFGGSRQSAASRSSGLRSGCVGIRLLCRLGRVLVYFPGQY